jgi:gamma-glutamylputrescine oxidase
MVPAPNQPATWFEETAVAPTQWPALTFDIDADVCVVGGGLAGITVARELARRSWSVVLIEAGRIGGQASGRNPGFVMPGFGQSTHRIVERCGLDHAKALWALSEQGMAYVRNAILGLAMPGVDPVDGWLEVSRDDASDAFRRTLNWFEGFGVDAEPWPAEQVREVLRTDAYRRGLHFPKAFHIHPLNYLLGLAADAERRGARLFQETVAVEMDPFGVRKRIATPSAKIRANHIVLAGGVQLGQVAPQLAATVLPLTSYVAVTQPLGYLADAITFPGGVSDLSDPNCQYRIVDWDRLVWSAGAPALAWDSRRQGRRIKAAIERTYPQLRGVEIARVWPATAAHAVHGMPQIGEVSPGLWLASAFAGHGINTTAIAGELIARAIADHDDTWRLFLPYDLVWAGGRLGRTALGANVWARRVGQGGKAILARRRRAGAGAPAAAVEDAKA